MKRKLLYKLSLVIVATLMFSSCYTDVDNYDAPSSTMMGNVIDKTTGKNILTSTDDFQIRIWETSWGDAVSPQNIPVKQDGTYLNTKLFNATYAMQPFNGPFWPAERTEGHVLKGELTQNFEVTPYLQITDFTWRLEGSNLYMTCKLKAPITEGLPNVREIKPFISWTKFCGATANLGELNPDDKHTKKLNKSWNEIGDMATGVGNETYEFGPIELIANPGYTYRVRLGANVNDNAQKYNYTEIVEFKVE
ncbi:DUF3823 domain-containing protein [Prevotella sp. 10(H)]|uniref:DUF3823 domain-containing protein n=1 Tax=Prevotella sp. 10(H) TaxID=1158294 RepID=UPI0004A72F07|nr:DUF3823 domain-containing protein [Prevotella sp. 10(H)]